MLAFRTDWGIYSLHLHIGGVLLVLYIMQL